MREPCVEGLVGGKACNRSRLSEIYKPLGETKTPPISYEIFPPKSGNYDNLIKELGALKDFNPALISITYGAGGTNRESTLELTRQIQNELDLNLMQHFTCVCSTREFIEHYLKEIESLGVKNILALKGDPPKDYPEPIKQDFSYANELVEFIKQKSALEISVAGYPEKHPAAPTLAEDILNLKRKINAGGAAIFTQLFFENDNFYKYCELITAQGVKTPVIAGILPVSNFSQLSKMASMCGVLLPRPMVEKFEKYKDSEADTTKLGIEFATLQCQKLIEFGVSGLHFYTLNRAYPTSEIIKNLS